MNRKKGAITGAILGLGIPMALVLANEVLLASKQLSSGASVADTIQICAFERRWFPLYPKVIHAKGCKNRTFDGLAPLLVLTSLGGALVGGASSGRGPQNRSLLTDAESTKPQEVLSSTNIQSKTATLSTQSSIPEPESTPSPSSIQAEVPETTTESTDSRSGNISEKNQIGSGLSGFALPLMLGVTMTGVGIIVANQLGFVKSSNTTSGTAHAAGCTAEIKTGKSPYPHYKANIPISFHSYGMYTQSNASTPTKYLIGERSLTIPISDLKNLSTGCSKLKRYIGD